MSDRLKTLTPQNVVLGLILAGTLTLNWAWWQSGGPAGRERERRFLEASTHVEELTRTVAELATTVAQLQAANDQLLQSAIQAPGRPALALESRLRAIEGRLEEETMMLRRFLEQYRRPD